jgi:hypothetical protein
MMIQRIGTLLLVASISYPCSVVTGMKKMFNWKHNITSSKLKDYHFYFPSSMKLQQ